VSPVTPFPDLERAREEAAQWIARAFRGLSQDESSALRDWSRRPENRRAMQDMSGVWQGLDVLSVLADLFPRDDLQATPAPAAPAPTSREAAPAARPASRLRWSLAAAVLLAVALGATYFSHRQDELVAARRALDAALQAQVYSSTVGEHRTIRLDDGSALALNSDTLVDVAYTPGLRAVNLHRGEAHFEVAHDDSRPFLVTANGRTVRAVGTAFSIRRRNDAELDVLVTEGVVSTYAAAATGGPSLAAPSTAARLSAGQLLLIRGGSHDRILRPSTVELEALTSWQRGVLILDGVTLEAALDEANRYSIKRIVIDDVRLKSLRLGGSFRTDDLGPMLRALQANFGIEIHEEVDGSLHLTRATPRG